MNLSTAQNMQYNTHYFVMFFKSKTCICRIAGIPIYSLEQCQSTGIARPCEYQDATRHGGLDA